MKRIFIFILFFAFAISAKAQFGGGGGITGRIYGTVIDSATQKPAAYISIAVYYSNGKAPINGMLTDEKGKFSINGLHAGSYRVTFTFIGAYKAKTINPVVTTLSKPDNNLGTVAIVPDNGTQLGEVQVNAAKPLIENHIDKIVYNAEKDLTSAGGNAADVLQKVPLVSVDINGNVAVRGDQNVKVLINGRPSGITSTSLSDALKAIPADQIKSIEVITSPSAKYDAEGSAGIINIITKSKNMSGISGSFSGGIGTKQNNGNLNLNYNKNRFSLSANLSGNLTWPQTTKTNFKQQTNNAGVIDSSAYNNASQMKRHALMGTLNASYQFNNYNTLSSDFRINGGGFHLHGTQNGTITGSPTYYGTTGSDNTLTGFDWSIDYDHKFHKTDEDLDLSAQWSHSAINTGFNYFYTAVNPSQRGTNDGLNNEYTLQADYTLPINKVFKLEAGGKSIFRRLSSDYNDFTLETDSTQYVYDGLNSNNYSYDQNVYAGYSVLTITLPKNYTILAGGRYEETTVNGQPDNTNQTELTTFNTSYGIFIPSLTIQKAINPSNTIKLSYSKRIQRPSLQFLNPFRNTQSVQAQSEGNPALSPEIAQTIELNYNSFIKSSVLNFSVYYKHTSDHIEGIAQPIVYIAGKDTIPATLTKYQNIGGLTSWGASFYGSINPIKILTIRGSVNVYTYQPDASLLYAAQQSSFSTSVQYNIFGSVSVNLPSGLIAEAFIVDNAKQRTIQGTNPGFYFYAFGIRKQFDNKKASIGFNTVNPFAYYENFNQNLHSPNLSQVRYTQVPFQSYGITFSYSFGKTTFSNPNDKKKGINNDDLKQGGGDQGGMGGSGGGGGSGAR